MAWEVRAGRVNSSRWAKWVDLEAASKHFECLKELINRAGTNELMSDGRIAYENHFPNGWEAEIRLLGAVRSDTEVQNWWTDRTAKQIERIQQIAQTVRGLALALDVLPIALATYQAARITGDRGGNELNIWSEVGGNVWNQATAIPLRAAAIPVLVERNYLALMYPYLRVDFDATGNVITRSEVPQPGQGSDGSMGYSAAISGWHAWDGWKFGWWMPGAGAAADFGEVTTLLPLSMAWEFWSEVAKTLLLLKINGALAQTASFIILRNVTLSKKLGGTGLPDTIVAFSAGLETAHLTGKDPLSPVQEQVVGTVVALIAAINPIAGAIAGIAVAVAELIARLLPPAVAVPVDVWGRRGFFLEQQANTGKLAPRSEPTAAIPTPVRAMAIPTPNPWTEGVFGEEPEQIVTDQSNDTDGGGGVGGVILVVGGLALVAKLLAG